MQTHSSIEISEGYLTLMSLITTVQFIAFLLQDIYRYSHERTGERRALIISHGVSIIELQSILSIRIG